MSNPFVRGGLYKTRGLKRCWFMLCWALTLISDGCNMEKQWQLHEISGHLPDLSFSLMSSTGQAVTDRTYQGYLLLLFFGFTRCSTECPTTLFRLAKVVQAIGADAKHTRILFVTLDPGRDTPVLMQRYLEAFDAEHIIGLIGNADTIENLSKRYRIAYRQSSSDVDESVHSAAVYVFDQQGHARLLITPHDEINWVVEDLHHLLALTH